MIFDIPNLSFSAGALALEGWPALAARGLCALALLCAGWFARRWLRLYLFPKLAAHRWKHAAAPILVNSFSAPMQRQALFTGMYLGLASLPWAAAAIPKFLLIAYEIVFTFCVCESLYKAEGIAELLLANSAEEIRANKTLVTLLGKAYKVLVVVFGAATIAEESGLPVGSILAGAGLAGLTVSLAAQDTAGNLFNGVMILLERPFAIGDWIKIGDVEGEVVDINFRCTKIRAADNSINIITNSTVGSSTINNGTQRTQRLYRFTISVPYSTPRAKLEQLMADLAAMLKASPHTSADTVFVKINGFGSAGIELILSAYLRTPDYIEFLGMQTELDLNILDIMKQNGVSFARAGSDLYIAGGQS